MSSEDYYQILGVPKSSDTTTIKKAYHKLALKYHPDKNPSPQAAEQFKKISEAYDVLSTPEKREIYDRHGKQGLNQNNMHFDERNVNEIFRSFFGGGGGGGGGGGVPFGQFGGPFGQFGGLFGGPFGNQFGHQNQGPQMIPPIEIGVDFEMNNLFTEKNIVTLIDRSSPCKQCQGTGCEDKVKRTCSQCQGRKMIQQQIRMGPIITMNVGPCPSCEGTGCDRKTNQCSKCHGKTTVTENMHVNFIVPLGHQEKDILLIQNEGHIGPDLTTRGDVTVRMKIKPHPIFLRHVDLHDKGTMSVGDLLTHVNLTLTESLCGFKRIILHVSGQNVTLEMTKVIKEGDLHIIENEGLPTKNNKRGKLFVCFHVEVPEQLSTEQRRKIREILSQ